MREESFEISRVLDINNYPEMVIILLDSKESKLALGITQSVLSDFQRQVDSLLRNGESYITANEQNVEDTLKNKGIVEYNVMAVGTSQTFDTMGSVSIFLHTKEGIQVNLKFSKELLTILNYKLIDARQYIYRQWKTALRDKVETEVLRSHKNPDETEVNIYLPNNLELFEQEKIVNACGEFMEAMGFEIKTEDEPILNSFWKRLQFAFKKNITPEDADRLLNVGKQALEMRLVDLHLAEQTDKLASAAEKVLKSIEKYDDASIRLGALLVVKRDGKVLVHQLTKGEVYLLDKRPGIIKDIDPLDTLQKLSGKGTMIEVPAEPDPIQTLVISETSTFVGDENVSDQTDDKDDKKMGSGNIK